MLRSAPIPVLGLLVLAACAAPPNDPPEPTPDAATQAPPTARPQVADLEAFGRFLARHPTPADFAAAYPGVVLVLPGQMATKELRSDRSRYFATLDESGRITGGTFQ